MVSVRLQGIHRIRARLADGTRVEYHKIRGVKDSRFWKSTDPYPVGSPEYLAAYQAAKHPPKKGDTFGRVIDDFLASNEFKNLSPRTQADYRLWCDRIRDKFGSAPVAVFEQRKIRDTAMKWRDKWSGKQAVYAWTVLRRIVNWARSRGKIEAYHFEGGTDIYKSDRADIIWTEPEIVQVEESAPDYIWKALRAACETGLRPGDLVRLSKKAHVQKTPKGRRIQIRTKKKKRLVAIPITRRMAEIIDAAPGDRILTDRDGKPWEEKRMTHAVTYWRDKLGIRKELRFYDARGSACTRLLAAGASLGEVATVMGWSSNTASRMIDVYAMLDPSFSDSIGDKLEKIRKKQDKAA